MKIIKILVGVIIVPMLIGYLSISASAQEECSFYQISDEQMMRESLHSMESTHSTENLVAEVELGNGLFCKIYEIDADVVYSSGTKNYTHDFDLYCDGTYFGTLRQQTTWSYDGVNRPTLDSVKNHFTSTDLEKNYLEIVNSTLSNYGTSSTSYNFQVKVYYNKIYLATTTFSTICDKNGSVSSIAVDD